MAETRRIGACVVLWYIASSVTNVSAKSFFKVFPSPILLTMLQCMVVTGFSYVLRGYEGRKAVNGKEAAQRERILNVQTLATVSGFLSVNTLFTVSNVSLAETLRCCQPMVTMVLAALCYRVESISLLQIMALLPTVAGGVISSLNDTTFSQYGLVLVLIANFSFSFRSLHMKSFVNSDEIGALEMFYQSTLRGSVWLFALLLICEGFVGTLSPIYPELEKRSLIWNSELFMSGKILGFVVINVLCFSINNHASIYVLSKMRATTHSVLNIPRRIFSIVASIFYFQTPVTPMSATGILLSVFGVWLHFQTIRNGKRRFKVVPKVDEPSQLELVEYTV